MSGYNLTAQAMRRPHFDGAACEGADPELFFPTRIDDIDPAAARICHGCPAIERCRVWALDNEEFGTWGGMDEWQRRSAKRRAKYAARKGGAA